MSLHELAGKVAPESMFINIPRLISSYYTLNPVEDVSFGTSGHRGSSFSGSFNENHIAATAQAVYEYRRLNKITGPLFLGFDTHALSEPAFRTALEVFAINDVNVIIHAGDEYTPTPVISFLILEYNQGRTNGFADGVVITPSHNPPSYGGFKYNPPTGGPGDKDITDWIEKRANQLLDKDFAGIKRISYEKARRADTTREKDFISPFVNNLSKVIDMEIISKKGIKIGVDPLGGSGINFWGPIAEKYDLNMEVINKRVDPTFSFMPLDWDGKIRMDCSSVYAMANLIKLKDRFDIAFGNDPDFDRHGIVTKDGLMNPNHYLSSAIWYLFQNRPLWNRDLCIGKTLVSSSMINKVASGLGRKVFEVPVGFKWFVDDLNKGIIGFCGEESAGATFLRKDGNVWTTDKDGFCMTLLAAEILAKTGKTPWEIYRDILIPEYGEPFYKRVDTPLDENAMAWFENLTPDTIKEKNIAGLPIVSIHTKAPGNKALIGGVKIQLSDGSWFAIRPSGTEPVMKLYIESFNGPDLWQKIYDKAILLINN